MSKPAVKIVETYDEFMVEVLKGKGEEDKAEESLMPNPCDPLESLIPTWCPSIWIFYGSGISCI